MTGKEMTNKSRFFLITGATGNIGARLTVDLLRSDPCVRVILLVRGKDDYSAWSRVMGILKSVGYGNLPLDWKSRVIVLAGDISEKQLGFSGGRYEALARQITHIIHSAAATSFIQSRQAALLTNYVGTVNVMKLAQRCQKKGRLVCAGYVSTAYVNRSGDKLIRETTLAHRSDFSNSYEFTKWKAERYVSSLMGTLPVMIFRPSIVMGDTVTGCTVAFNVVYIPIKQISERPSCWLPGAANTSLDVVPVNFVTASILQIIRDSSNCGKIFHIVAGPSNSTTCGGIIRAAQKYLSSHGLAAGKVKFVPLSKLQRLSGKLPEDIRYTRQMMKMLSPYMSNNWAFDDTNLREALRHTDIKCPCPKSYFDKILDYSILTDWGRKLRKTA